MEGLVVIGTAVGHDIARIVAVGAQDEFLQPVFGAIYLRIISYLRHSLLQGFKYEGFC